ncbi:MAG: FAD-dependent monooxygenase [Rhizobiaceae bacterium]|nr:FAD-dependent monooxygenase [Rhizobiaceae bacterium]
MKRRTEIAIVGAGPAGLAAALFLARAGFSPTIYERFDEPKPVGSGLILQPTGLAALDALGLLPAILACGNRIERLYGTDARSGRVVLDVGYGGYGNGRFGLGVHRAALFDVLHNAALAAGISVVTGSKINALRNSGDKIELVAAGGQTLAAADLAVDASGARSALKPKASRGNEVKPLAYGALWASLKRHDEGFLANALQQRYERASVMIGVLPIGSIAPGAERLAAFFWSVRLADAEKLYAGGLDAWKARVAGYWPECQPYLDQIADFDELALARYGHHTLRPPVAERLAVIGDAAHSTSPQLGQGANMALLDAAALASALTAHDDMATALAAYARARRSHVALFQLLSYALTPFYQSDSRLIPYLRDTLVATVAKVPPMPALLAALVSGTLLNPFAGAGFTEPDWRSFK